MSGLTGPSDGNMARRRLVSTLFRYCCTLVTWTGIVILGVLLFYVSRQGLKWVDLQFLSSFPSRFPERAGIKSALYGTIWVASLTAAFSVPIGVAAAIYLEEYAEKGLLSRVVEINISNLAGVPSIVYGILGLVVFVRFFALDRSVLAGALTMSLLTLPVVIISSREAIRSVPGSTRQAAYALGATKWQTVKSHILPAAMPGILTGVILAMSRIIGETAPLVMMGALTFVSFVPDGPMDDFTVLPVQIYNWASRPQEKFHQLAAATIIVLLSVLLFMNATAVYIRHRAGKGMK